MSELPPAPELPPPGGVAWLDVSAQTSESWPGRVRTGPLGLQINPLSGGRAPYYFRGARLRGTRCIWSVATVSGAELSRRARPPRALPDPVIHLLARADAGGSVFDPVGATGRAALHVFDSTQEIREQFPGNTHVFTLSVQRATIGMETASLGELIGESFDISAFQAQVLRSGVGLVQHGSDDLTSSSSLVGVDRFLGSMAGLLLRTVVRRSTSEVELMESIRSRTDTIIYEQADNADLSPSTIAQQLNISLRQLYRAFNGTESPAARIRRRRLEHAAELLAARAAPSQVDKIAQQCGFVSAEYFSRAFRREFGLSPRAYRTAHRDRPVLRGDVGRAGLEPATEGL